MVICITWYRDVWMGPKVVLSRRNLNLTSVTRCKNLIMSGRFSQLFSQKSLYPPPPSETNQKADMLAPPPKCHKHWKPQMRQYFISGFRVFEVPGYKIGSGKLARKKIVWLDPPKMAIFRPKSRHIGSRCSRLQNSLKQLISPWNLNCTNILLSIFTFLGSLGGKEAKENTCKKFHGLPLFRGRLNCHLWAKMGTDWNTSVQA